MAVSQIAVQRLSLISSKSFAEVVSVIDAAIGHPDLHEFWENVSAAGAWQELEHVVHNAIGPSGLMEFTRFDHGQVLKKGSSAAPKMLRVVMGNPLIMKQMAEKVPDAGSYAPVTVLIDERADGVHLTYDFMAAYLASYGNLAALTVARDLDSKIETLLRAAAG